MGNPVTKSLDNTYRLISKDYMSFDELEEKLKKTNVWVGSATMWKDVETLHKMDLISIDLEGKFRKKQSR